MNENTNSNKDEVVVNERTHQSPKPLLRVAKIYIGFGIAAILTLALIATFSKEIINFLAPLFS